jgi:hypothetical protein
MDGNRKKIPSLKRRGIIGSSAHSDSDFSLKSASLFRLPLFFFPFFHALGEAGFRVDESFSGVTHGWS